MKRFLSVFLTVILVLTAGIEWTAVRSEAANFTPRLTCPNQNDVCYTTYGWSSSSPNCVSYAKGRAYEITGYQTPLYGNGKEWWTNNQKYNWYPSGQTPRVGAIACWGAPMGGGYGHVGVVEIVDGNNVVVSMSGTSFTNGEPFRIYQFTDPNGRMDPYNHTSWGNCDKGDKCKNWHYIPATGGFQGYIYLVDSTTSPQPVQVFSNVRTSEIYSDDATIYADVPSKPYCTEVGFYISTDSSMANARRIPETVNCQVPGVFYNMKKWYGTLSENTTYYYKIYAVSGGTEYTTDVHSFTTLTTSPGDALFSSIYPENVTENDARITGILSGYKTIQDCGFQISTNPDMSGCATHYESDKNAGVNGAYAASIGYTMSQWHGTLQKGTVYYYRLFVKINGTTYMTSVQSFKTAGDSTSPVIQGVNVVSIDGNGYTISAKAADETGMMKISFPTWTEYNGQDDIKAEWWDTTAVTSPDANGNYTYRVNISDHNYEGGKYITHVYAYDTSGNYDVAGIEVYVYPLVSISLSESNITLNKGDTKYLTVGFNPEYTTDNGSISFTSSNNNVATVDDTGKVTAKAVGTTTITASVSEKTATCTVTVKSPLKSISLSKTSLDLTEGDSSALSVSYNPTDTTDSKAITWSSSNTKVATVDKSGKVTAVAAGTATITATSSVNGVKAATCTVNVKKKEIHLKSISLSKTSISLTEGGSETITVSYDPSNTTDSKAIKWSSSDTKVATVDKNGKVTAVGAGSATITATSAVKGVDSKKCTVNVSAKKKDDNSGNSGNSGSGNSGGSGNGGSGNSGGSGNGGNTVTDKTPIFGWFTKNGNDYWYENGIRQGTVNDPNGVWGDGTNRGREIYDPVSDGWYWLDSIYDGAKASGKEVWMPYIYQNEDEWDDETIRNIANESDPGMADCVYNAIKNKSGKWVRYDPNGMMIKGWVTIEGQYADCYPDQAGNTYYYDTRTGLMAKGEVTIDGQKHYFDEVTGALKW